MNLEAGWRRWKQWRAGCSPCSSPPSMLHQTPEEETTGSLSLRRLWGFSEEWGVQGPFKVNGTSDKTGISPSLNYGEQWAQTETLEKKIWRAWVPGTWEKPNEGHPEITEEGFQEELWSFTSRCRQEPEDVASGSFFTHTPGSSKHTRNPSEDVRRETAELFMRVWWHSLPWACVFLHMDLERRFRTTEVLWLTRTSASGTNCPLHLDQCC